MRKLLTLILLIGAFYGGYHVGRLPGAPDLSPFAKRCYGQAAQLTRRAVQWGSTEWQKVQAEQPAEAEQPTTADQPAAGDQTVPADCGQMAN